MSLLGGGTQSQTSKVKLTPQQKLLAAKGGREIIDWANANPTAPTSMTAGTSIEPFNATQQAAQSAALGAAPAQAHIASGAAGATDFLFHDALSPDTNPYLKQYADYATDPILTAGSKLLGQARGGANMLGQYGGTRQGLVEGSAIDSTLRNYGGARAGMFNEAYSHGLDALVKALGLAPQTADLQTAAARTTANVGDSQHALAQAQLNEQRQQEQLAQLWPLIQGKELLGTVGMIPTAGTTTTASAPQTSIVGGALGGAATGASIGSAVPGVGTAAGAAGGAGLGALMALLS